MVYGSLEVVVEYGRILVFSSIVDGFLCYRFDIIYGYGDSRYSFKSVGGFVSVYDL